MSLWRCPECGREMRNGETASFEVVPIVKPRGGGVDQFSIGGTRRTCPDHVGVRLERFDRAATHRVGHAFAGGGHGHA